jgi:hypothetical protein
MREAITLRARRDDAREASAERDPGVEETQQEHLPLLGDLEREHRAMVQERDDEQRAAQNSFRMTMYRWGLRTWGGASQGES